MLERNKPENKDRGSESKLTPAAMALLAALGTADLANAQQTTQGAEVAAVQEEYKQAEQKFQIDIQRIYSDKLLNAEQRTAQVDAAMAQVTEVEKRKRDTEWRDYIQNTIAKPLREILSGTRRELDK